MRQVRCVVAEAARKGLKRPNFPMSEDKTIEHVCHLYDGATQKAMRRYSVWESTNDEYKRTWQLAEITCPWAWADHNGEIFEKSYMKKVGKYDQIRREISETYPGKPVEPSTIVVSATGATMKRSPAEFSKVTRPAGKDLARWSRNAVDMAMRGSYDIYVDIMQRAR
jgi:hypothetical protein